MIVLEIICGVKYFLTYKKTLIKGTCPLREQYTVIYNECMENIEPTFSKSVYVTL